MCLIQGGGGVVLIVAWAGSQKFFRKLINVGLLIRRGGGDLFCTIDKIRKFFQGIQTNHF